MTEATFVEFMDGATLAGSLRAKWEKIRVKVTRLRVDDGSKARLMKPIFIAEEDQKNMESRLGRRFQQMIDHREGQRFESVSFLACNALIEVLE